jgi:hypothetical protein
MDMATAVGELIRGIAGWSGATGAQALNPNTRVRLIETAVLMLDASLGECLRANSGR